MNQKLKQMINPAFELAYLLCIFFMYLEIAIPLPLSVYKIFYCIVFIALACKLFMQRGKGIKTLTRSSASRLNNASIIFYLLLFYILADIAGIFYSPIPDFAISKYLVVIPMLLFLLPTLYYIKGTKQLDAIYKTLAFSSFSVGGASLLNYFVFELIPLPYLRRISMIADYNRYAENIYIGMVLGAFFILNSRMKRRTQTVLLFSHITLHTIILTLSGSRRTFILLFPAIITVLLYHAFYITRYSSSKLIACKRLAVSAMLVVFCVLAVSLTEKGFKGYSDRRYQQEVIDSGGEIAEENSVDNVIETIGTGGMFDKRAVIWRVAYEAAVKYDLQDIIIGRGSGYEVHLYDISNDKELNEAYKNIKSKQKNWMSPHNFILADFLSGGIIRLLPSLALFFAIFVLSIRLCFMRPGRGLPHIITMALVYFNAFISGRYGFIYDKFYYIILACLIAEGAYARHADNADTEIKG